MRLTLFGQGRKYTYDSLIFSYLIEMGKVCLASNIVKPDSIFSIDTWVTHARPAKFTRFQAVFNYITRIQCLIDVYYCTIYSFNGYGLGATSIEKIPKISAYGRNFLDPLPHLR